MHPTLPLLARTFALFVALASWLLPLRAQDISPTGPALSPFAGMRLEGGVLQVQVDDDTWYRLQSIEAIDGKTLVDEAQRRCGSKWWKRLTEDLPALLAAIDKAPGATVDLQLQQLDDGQLVERTAVLMTHEKRQNLRRVHGGKNPLPVLTTAMFAGALPAADVAADLVVLRQLLDEHFAYRHLRDVDLDALLQGVRERATQGLSHTQFAAEVDRILRRFGDGHSRLSGGQTDESPLSLPLLVQQVQGGHAAFAPDRSALLDAAHPFVVAIAGVPLERWLAAARERACQGSPAMIARNCERGLRDLVPLLGALDVPLAERFTVTLRGDAGTVEQELAMTPSRPTYGSWPRTASRLLADNVGYLRIASMRSDAQFLAAIDASMQEFADTRALIVDVRGNGGGSRDALRRLFPYLLAEADGPQVVNVARVLLQAGGPSTDLLFDRGMYLQDDARWNDAERAAITAFARTFAARWTPPKGTFSPPHYLVLSREGNPGAFHYDKPVRVLIDADCFSATDIFVAALRTRPQVQLVGGATSGGSGRARGFVLPRSRLQLQLSSMVSYRPDGQLFETHGNTPDVPCLPQAGDLVNGGGDAVLQAALASLR